MEWPKEVLLCVQEACVLGSTFSSFVWNTRWLGKNRSFALKVWLRTQPAGSWWTPFEGTDEEVQVVRDHVCG
jgi:hypothetical protein